MDLSRTCLLCGATNDDYAKYCRSCGSPLPINVKCIKCGYDNKLLPSKFCTQCGNPFPNFIYQNIGKLLVPFISEGKIGYIDYWNQHVYILPQFYKGRVFSDNLAAVKFTKDSKWTFVNEVGTRISQSEYDECLDFNWGYAIVRNDKLYGVINHFGEEVLRCVYPYICRLDKDYFHTIKDGTSSLLNLDFKCIYKSEKYVIHTIIHTGTSKLIVIKSKSRFDLLDERYGLVNEEGIIITEPKYENINDFSDGLCAVSIPSGENKLWGYIDETGNEVIPCKFYEAYDFQDGIAVYRKRFPEITEYITANGTKIGFPYGYFADGLIDKKGNIILEAKEYRFNEAYNQLYKYKNENGLEGYIDYQENIIIPFVYSKINKFYNGFAIAQDKNGNFGVINPKGEPIVPFGQYDSIVANKDFPTKEGIIIIKRAGKYGVTNLENRVIIPCEYDEIELGNPNTFIVKKDKFYCLFDNNGKALLPLNKYTSINKVYNSLGLDLYKIQNADGMMGIVDNKGQTRVKCKYFSIGNVNMGWINLDEGCSEPYNRTNLVPEVQFHERDQHNNRICGICDLFGNEHITRR